MYQKYR